MRLLTSQTFRICTGSISVPRQGGSIRMSFDSFVAGSDELARSNKSIETGKIVCPSQRIFARRCAGAHKRLEAGHLLGKLVLLAR